MQFLESRPLVVDARDSDSKTKDLKKGRPWIFQNPGRPRPGAQKESAARPTAVPWGGDPDAVDPFDTLSSAPCMSHVNRGHDTLFAVLGFRGLRLDNDTCMPQRTDFNMRSNFAT